MENQTTSKKGLSRGAIILVFGILLGFLAILGWGLRNAQAGPVQIGQKVPTFDLTTFDGEVVSTSDLQGKVIVVNFWASWCKPCEQEAADLESAWQIYNDTDDVYFFGVAYVDIEPKSREYVQKFNITYPNGPDLRTKISTMFRVRGVPETYIIDRQGKLADFKIGPYSSLGEIQAMIDPIIAQ